MTIDWTKSVCCRNKREVRIAGRDGPGLQCVAGWSKDPDGWCLRSWQADGKYFHGDNESQFDLINVPEAPKRFEYVRWCNVYPDDRYGSYHTRDDANACASDGRIACIRLVIAGTEGDGL